MAEAGEIKVRVLMFPLDNHKGAKEQTIAVICDGKGFDELEANYTSENQCAEGKAKVEETIAFLRKKGIGSTPTYIFPDGLYSAGALTEAPLRSRLGIGAAEGKKEKKN